MTLADVEIASYPFTTIKPNRGISFVRVECVEKEFNVKCNPREGYCVDGIRFVPVELLDVAGLVPGAYEGKGMGNMFLSDLSQADVLVHVIDISGSINEKGEQVNPLSYNPENDVLFLENELDVKMEYTQLPVRESDQKIFVADLTKAKELIGWEPKISLDDGLEATIEYFKKQ